MKKLYKELKKKGVINDKVTLGDVWNKQHGGSHYQKYKIQYKDPREKKDGWLWGVFFYA